MKTRAERALHLCGEYDRLMSAIAKLKSDVGDGLEQCDRRVSTGGLDGYGDVSYIPDGKQTHLADAFEPHYRNFDDDAVYATEQEQIEIIGECEGCLKAWKAVRDRKAARKALGIVKRQIRMIGRGATDRDYLATQGLWVAGIASREDDRAALE